MSHQTTEQRAAYETRPVFQSPNYTQTPNDFFALLSEMGDAEMRVTLVMIRETFGYHRDGFKMGIHKLALAAGLSDNGAKAGAEAAEERGTFRRTNPDAQTEAEWELVVEQPVTPSASDPLLGEVGQPVTQGGSASDPQVGIKERVKKENKSTTTARNIFKFYEAEIGPLTPTISEELTELEITHGSAWVCDAIVEASRMQKRNMKYISAILTRWKVEGRGDKPKPIQTRPKYGGKASPVDLQTGLDAFVQRHAAKPGAS